jgi:hypothetical protein
MNPAQEQDDLMGYEVRAHRDQWARADYREGVRANMRRQLYLAMADAGVVPVKQPVETLRYLPPGHWMPGTDVPEVSAELAESGDADWETVEVRLAVPVRKAR